MAAFAAFYLVPWLPLSLLAFCVLAYLTWRRLDLALALVVLAAPLFMHPRHIGHLEFAPSEILILLDVVVAVGYLFWPGTRGRVDLGAVRRSRFFWPAVLFLLAATISTVAAADRHVALRTYREVVIEPMAFFALLLSVRASDATRVVRLFALLGAGLLAAAVGLGQWVTGRGLAQTPGTSVRLVQSVYTSADNLGLLLDRVLPVWLGVWLACRRNTWLRWLGLVAGLLVVLVLALSRSRGAELGVAAGALLVVVALYGRAHRTRIALLALLILGLVVGVAAGARVVEAVNAGHANTVQERLYLWHSAERMIVDHPLLGIGPDNFLHYYAPRLHGPGWFRWLQCDPGLGYLDPHQVSVDQPCLSHPHDELLDFWLSTGVLGLVAFIWLQVVFWRGAAGNLLRLEGWRRPLLAGVMGAMFAALVHGLVDNSYFLPDLSVFFWLLCASAEWLWAARPMEAP